MADKDVDVDVTVNDKTAPGLASVARKFDDIDRKRKRSSKDTSDSTVHDAEKALGSIEKITNQAASALSDKLGGVFKALPPQAQTGIVAGVTAGAAIAAPILVETLSTALSLGAGGTVLIAGVILAARDPRIGAAWSATGTDILSRLDRAVLPFSEQLIGAAQDADAAFVRVEGDLDTAFANLAPTVRQVTDGILEMVTRAMPGIAKAATASVPLFGELSTATARWGDELDSLFSGVAQSGPGMTMFFHFLLLNVDAVIVSLDALVRSVGPAFNLISALMNLTGLTNTADGVARVGRNIGEAGLQAQAAAPDFAALSAQLAATDQNADRMAQTMVDKVFSSMMGLDNANLGVARSLTQMDKALKENKRSLDIHTEAGQADTQAILNAVAANIQQYDSLIQAGAGATQAAAAYDTNTAALEANLRKAGLTKAQVEGLIGKYREVPDTVNTNIVMQGLTDAINNLADVIRKLNGLDGRNVKSTVTTIYKEVGRPPVGEKGTIPLRGGSAFMAVASWQARADAMTHAAMSGPAGGVQRTGGPRDAINVRNVINLDGRLFREWTDERVEQASERAAWRQRVGSR